MAQGTADVRESRKVGDAELVTVGIDVSDRYSQLCVLRGEGEIVREERVRTTTAALTRALAPLQDARVVLEVGPRSPWLSRMLSELGHDVIVANPRQVALIARSQRKTDRSDAEHLARLGRFDPKLLFPIRHRGATAQADLQVLRSRDALVRARTALINHVRGAVKAWGAALPGCTTPAFHRTVESHIPEELRPALLPVLRQIEQLTGAIRQADKKLAALCERYAETAALRQIVGVGPITSLTFILTIEDPHRFPKNREVGPYLGLAPRSRDSGDRQPQLRITKEGDVALRRVLNQAAHYILGPFGPDSDLRRWGLRYAESGAGNAKKRAVVAVARRLAVLLLALWKSGESLRAVAPRARGRGCVADSTRGARRPGGRWASEDTRDADTWATAEPPGPNEDGNKIAAPTPWRQVDHRAPCRSPGSSYQSSPESFDHPGQPVGGLISVPVCVVNHLLAAPRAGRGAARAAGGSSRPRSRSGSWRWRAGRGALFPRIGSSKRPSHSSTARFEVMTKLELRWRPMTSS